jgi:hypothetical protein
MSGRKRESEHREKLDQPDHPESKGRASALVELPAYGDGLHLDAKSGDDVTDEKETVVADTECGVGIVTPGFTAWRVVGHRAFG